MGFWDTLCLHCGVAPDGGPDYLLGAHELEEVQAVILKDLAALGDWDPPDDLPQIVEDLLKGALCDEYGSREDNILLEGTGSGEYSTNYVAVGYWDERGDAAFFHEPRGSKIPDGRRVQVLRLRHADGYGGKFNYRLVPGADGKEKEVYQYTNCDPRETPCVFLCEHCYYYLEKWLERDRLPERHCAFPSDPEPMSFAGELYEVVNSQEGLREYNGLLGVIDYDGIEDSLRQCQDFVLPGCWNGPRKLAPAIRAGLRGVDLHPALLRDSRAWMFMRPDIWPEPSADFYAPCFTEYNTKPASTVPVLSRLPLELMLPILADLPLLSLLALSSTCRALRAFITDATFLDRVLKDSLVHGSIRWILPVDTMPGDELERACKTLERWLGSGGGNISESTKHQDAVALVTSSGFPSLAFVRACWESDSMMNRKRLWRQARQFETLWRDYRVNGWPEDVFFPSDDFETDEDNSEASYP